MIGNWYYCPGAGKVKAHRMTIAERFRLWRRRRKGLYIDLRIDK